MSVLVYQRHMKYSQMLKLTLMCKFEFEKEIKSYTVH